MPTTYTWKSLRKSNEVIESINSLTNRRTRMERFSSTIKHLGSNEANFSIWFDSSYIEPNYYTPTLKGKIKDLPSGCTVSARALIISATLSNAFVIGFVTMFFVLGIAALYSGFNGAVFVLVICSIFSIGSLLWFLHTFNKFRYMRVQLEIMKLATGVDYHVSEH